MIKITDKHNCCGCESCAQRCPKRCIDMIPDDDGFLYPNVNENACVNCGMCERVCPIINQNNQRKPLATYAAINYNEIDRKKSSSGGVFTVIAESVINEGGVVYGAQFNDVWEVIHNHIERVEEIDRLRGSKYVQSRTGKTFQEAEVYLKTGRKVLYSGTPCQISGLKKFLHKEYNNLLTVEVICHGVPSCKLWKDYLCSLDNPSNIERVNMKDKTDGWKGYKITIKSDKEELSEPVSNNKYMIAFFQNLTLRPSCFHCPAKKGKSGSDIALADYWGVDKLQPSMYDNKGTSLVCAYSDKGKILIENLYIKKEKADYDICIHYNKNIEESSSEPAQRATFMNELRVKGISALYSLKPSKKKIIMRAISWLQRNMK